MSDTTDNRIGAQSTGAVGSDDDSWSSEQWTSVLANRYFSPLFILEPVTFCVDSDELASMRGIPADEAVEELSRVVRRAVMPGYDFAPLWYECRRWQEEGCLGLPPSLPLLALNVLAAGQMTANRVGAPNFYAPFRQLLDPTDEIGGMPGNYDEYVPQMWEQLSWWLDDHLGGERGISTITKHEHFVNIGYARQQAILHASDRRRLRRFLRSIGFEPGDDVVPEELRRALRIWARRLGSVGDRLVRLATDQSLEPYADELIRRVAEKWDGSTRDPRTGAPILQIRVLVEDRPFAIGLAVRRRDDDPTAIDLTGAVSELLLASQGDFYSPAPLPLDIADVLDFGIEISGIEAALTFDPAPILPLAYDDDLAGWISTNGISFGEVYCLLVRKEEWTSLQTWIAEEGLAGEIDTGATRNLPTGWFLIRRFRIDARPQCRPPPGIADLLGSSGGARTRLVGGLTVGGLRRTYLLGGLPFLAIPSDDVSVPVELELDGLDTVQLRAEGGELSLNEINLGQGAYRVTHPRGKLEFDVVAWFSQQPGPGVGSIRQSGAGGRSARGFVATMPSPSPPVAVAVPHEFSCVLLGPSPGEIAPVETPRWLKDPLGELSWTATDTWCEFNPVWLVTLGSKCTARLIEPHEPKPGPVGTWWADLVMEAELENSDEATAELWQRYRDLAGESR
ncbi:MAG: hypothetical protein OXG50_11265 [bacterium]|nr:hypothetical protein [bacterium]